MIRNYILKTKFYNELTESDKQKYFNQVRDKFIPNIDNIYYSVYLKDDYDGNSTLVDFFNNIKALREQFINTKDPIQVNGDLYIDVKKIRGYDICLTNPNLYDVFVSSYLMNKDTPRIQVQIRSEGLWIKGYESMLNDSYLSVKNLFNSLGVEIKCVMETRIDYCYHTNILQNPDSMFSDISLSKYMKTTFKKMNDYSDLHMVNDKLTISKRYIGLGSRNSNSLFFRIYDKVNEVIEMGYKNYFFKVWYDSGLINYYDMFCFNYAYEYNNDSYIYKGQLEFYIKYGKDNNLKNEFKLALDDKSYDLDDYKKLARKYMPKNTRVINIEFMTKRKYYYSLKPDIINQLFKISKDINVIDTDLNRLYKLICNRDTFLDMLTDEIVSFRDKEGNYLSWWKRLRSTKIKNVMNSNVKLVREYAKKIDRKKAMNKYVRDTAKLSLYRDKYCNDSFDEAVLNNLAYINDNDIYRDYGVLFEKEKATQFAKLKNRL